MRYVRLHSRYKIWRVGVFTSFLLLVSIMPHTLRADDGALSVTITPPLYQLSIGPGEAWASTLKIINSNPYDVTFYAQLADMQASGEDGRSKFTPILNGEQGSSTDSYMLAHWIHLSSDPIHIKAGASADLPFTITVPPNAEPGGHYAAILVGTQPDALHATGTQLKVASLVSSLLFVRIKGDITESGRIREFITAKDLYQTPKADFTLRFENTGNTHVRPQGDITIFNMWGKERGRVDINRESDFGNVLPKSIRRFEFSWEGEQDLFDIGLYNAEVTLAFGEDGKQNVSSKAYFWVVPLVPVTVGTGVLLFFILSLVWFIRRYIRRALMLEQKRLGLYAAPAALPRTPEPIAPAPVSTKTSITRALAHPITEGVIDLRSVAGKKAVAAPAHIPESPKTIVQFFGKYRFFILFIVILIVGGAVLWHYFSKVLVKSRGFQITDVQIREEAPAATTTRAR